MNTSKEYRRSWLAPLRAALRPAVRELKFHRLRSLAAILLIAIPVALTSFMMADDSARTRATNFDSNTTYATYYGGTCEQDSRNGYFSCTDSAGDVIARSLPTGEHEEGHRNGNARILELVSPALPEGASASAISYSTIAMAAGPEKLGKGTYTLIPDDVPGPLAQHVPDAGDIAIPRHYAKELGVSVGDSITVWAEESPNEKKTLTISELTPLGYSITSEPLATSHANPTVDLQGGVEIYTAQKLSWADVKELNRSGFVVTGTEVSGLHVPRSEQYPQFVDLDEPQFEGNSSSIFETISWFALFLTAAILVLLLISPVFSISASRNTSVFALMRSQGASKRDIFRAVIFYGLVAGVVGTAVGWIVGMGAAFASWKWSYPTWPFEPDTLTAVMIPVVAIIGAVVVSMLPAAIASRIDIIAGITGAPTGKLMQWRSQMLVGPIVLAAAIAMYTAPRLLPASSDNTPAVFSMLYAFAPVVALIGLALSAPALAYAAGSWTKPLTMRLAGRELRRNTMRTVPVIAAIAGLVFISSSITSGSTNYYRYQSDQADRVFSQNFGVLGESPDWELGMENSEQLAPGVVENLDEANANNVKRLYSQGIDLARKEVGAGSDIVVYSTHNVYSNSYSTVSLDSAYEQACSQYVDSKEDGPLFTDESVANRCAYENMLDYNDMPSALGKDLIADESVLELFQLSEADKQVARDTLRKGGVLAAKHHGSSDSMRIEFEETTFNDQGNDEGNRTTTADLPVAAVLPDSFPGVVLSFSAAKELGITAGAANVLLVSSASDRTIANTAELFYEEGITQYFEPLKDVADYSIVIGLPLGVAGIVVAVLGLVIALSLPHIRRTFEQYSAVGASQKTLRRIGSLYTGVMAAVAVVPGYLLSVAASTLQNQLSQTAANGVQVASHQGYSFADNLISAMIFLIGIPLLAFLVGWITTPKVSMKYRQD